MMTGNTPVEITFELVNAEDVEPILDLVENIRKTHPDIAIAGVNIRVHSGN